MAKQPLTYFNDATTGVFKNNTAGDIGADDIRELVDSTFGGIYHNPTVDSTDEATKTGVVNQITLISIAGLTQNCVWTPPATAAVGDICGYYLTAGDDTYSLRLSNLASDDIDGTDYNGGEYTSHFITGESVILKCIVANTSWIVLHENRIPCEFEMARTSNVTSITAGTFPLTTGYGTPSINIGNCANASTGLVTTRRAGRWSVGAKARLTTTGLGGLADGETYGSYIYRNETNDAAALRLTLTAGATGFVEPAPFGTIACSKGDTIGARYYVAGVDFNVGGGSAWNYAQFKGIELF